MKCRLLASFLLGFILVLNALGGSSARASLGLEKKENKPEFTSTGMFVQKESSDRTGAAHTRKLGPGGSNLMAQKEPSKEDDALKKSMASLLKQMDDQEHMTVWQPKASKSADFVIPRSNFNERNQKCYCLQYSNAQVVDGGGLESPSRPAQRQMSEEHPQKDEAKNLNEDAREIVNLMHKDYKGMASGKPPINNNEPRN